MILDSGFSLTTHLLQEKTLLSNEIEKIKSENIALKDKLSRQSLSVLPKDSLLSRVKSNEENSRIENYEIAGSYSGYFIDDLNSKIPTYLKIEINEVTGVIKFFFKNQYSFMEVGYFTNEKHILDINKLGRGWVKKENDYLIIESFDEKWMFKKDFLRL